MGKWCNHIQREGYSRSLSPTCESHHLEWRKFHRQQGSSEAVEQLTLLVIISPDSSETKKQLNLIDQYIAPNQY